MDTARLPTENSKKTVIPLNSLIANCHYNDKDRLNIRMVAKALHWLVDIIFCSNLNTDRSLAYPEYPQFKFCNLSTIDVNLGVSITSISA